MKSAAIFVSTFIVILLGVFPIVASLQCYHCVSPVSWDECMSHATVENCSALPELAKYSADKISCGRFTVQASKGPANAKVHIARCIPDTDKQATCRGVGILPGVESDVTECSKCGGDLCNA